MSLFNFFIAELKKVVWQKKICIVFIIQAILFFIVISNFFGSLPNLYERWYEKSKDIIQYGTFFTYFSASLSNRVFFIITISICNLTFLVNEMEKKNLLIRNLFFLPPKYCSYFLSKFIICNFAIFFQLMFYATIFYFLYSSGIEPYIKAELEELTILDIAINFFYYFIKTISITAVVLNISFFLKRKQFYTILICIIITYSMSFIKFSPSNSLFEYKLFINDEIILVDGLLIGFWLLLSIGISYKILSTQL
ncbi:hypothetical protein [Aquirufa sp. OSTEICH-129A]